MVLEENGVPEAESMAPEIKSLAPEAESMAPEAVIEALIIDSRILPLLLPWSSHQSRLPTFSQSRLDMHPYLPLHKVTVGRSDIFPLCTNL